jgi:hypothetical protein
MGGGQSNQGQGYNNYNTQAPNYADLKAKHTAGYQDPVSGTRTSPQAFNFNGTVYQYEPDSDGYRDTYTGQLLTQGSDSVGSLGIAGLYANEISQNNPQSTPPPQPVQPPQPPQPVQPVQLSQPIAQGIRSVYDLARARQRDRLQLNRERDHR